MTNTVKRTLFLFAVVSAACAVLSGCGNNQEGAAQESQPTATVTAARLGPLTSGMTLKDVESKLGISWSTSFTYNPFTGPPDDGRPRIESVQFLHADEPWFPMGGSSNKKKTSCGFVADRLYRLTYIFTDTCGYIPGNRSTHGVKEKIERNAKTITDVIQEKYKLTDSTTYFDYGNGSEITGKVYRDGSTVIIVTGPQYVTMGGDGQWTNDVITLTINYVDANASKDLKPLWEAAVERVRIKGAAAEEKRLKEARDAEASRTKAKQEQDSKLRNSL